MEPCGSCCSDPHLTPALAEQRIWVPLPCPNLVPGAQPQTPARACVLASGPVSNGLTTWHPDKTGSGSQFHCGNERLGALLTSPWAPLSLFLVKAAPPPLPFAFASSSILRTFQASLASQTSLAHPMPTVHLLLSILEP